MIIGAMTETFPLTTQVLQTATALPAWALLRAQGVDACSFLHNLLTQDVLLLKAPNARLAALCSPKGRVLSSFVLIKRADDDFLLLTPADNAPAMLKRLSMFVLRSKVKLTDESATWQICGVLGTGLGAWDGAVTADGQHLVGLYPDGEKSRALLVSPTEASVETPGALAEWAVGEIRSGVATIGAAHTDAFVPQMLNFESVGGVNFKKGCYPGQEVVARSQFRGTTKRRTFVGNSSGELTLGDAITAIVDGTSQDVGTVVQAAPGWALACLQLASAQAELTAGGAAFHLLPLPYPLLMDL